MRTLFIFCALLISTMVHADIITLKNGDQITGSISDFDADKVIVSTEYAGDIPIQRSGIAYIQTDSPKTLLIEDEAQPVEAQLIVEEGTQKISTPEGSRNVDLNSVAGLYKVPEEPRPWSGSVVAGATVRSGNTDTLDANLSAEAVREKGKNKLTLSAFTAYGRVEEELSARRYKGEVKFQRYPSERLFWYILGSAEHDAGRKLDARYIVSTGLGYDWIKNDKRSLSTEFGVQQTWEEWAPYTPAEKDKLKAANRVLAVGGMQTALNSILMGTITTDTLQGLFGNANVYLNPLSGLQGRDNDYLSARIALNYEQSLFEKATLSDSLVLIPSIEEFGEIRLSNTLSLSTPLTQAIDLKLSLLSEYDSLAEESGVDEWDHTLVAGASYAFGEK